MILHSKFGIYYQSISWVSLVKTVWTEMTRFDIITDIKICKLAKVESSKPSVD